MSADTIDLESDYEEVEESGEVEIEHITIDSQTACFQVSGRFGAGKTWFCLSECFSACLTMGLKRIISNVKILKVPDIVKYELKDVQICYVTDIREVFRLLETAIPTAVVWDEISKSVNTRMAHSNFNIVITRLLGDLRKSNVRFFCYSHQSRHESDILVRTQNSAIFLPNHKINVDGYPQAWVWRDNEEFEYDFKRGHEHYDYGVLMEADFKIPEIDGCYDTFQRIPMNINPSLKEEEIVEVMPRLLSFCDSHDIPIREAQVSDKKVFLKRWNENDPTNIVPYTPKALDLLLSELIARQPVAKDSTAVLVRVNDDDVDSEFKKFLEWSLSKGFNPREYPKSEVIGLLKRWNFQNVVRFDSDSLEIIATVLSKEKRIAEVKPPSSEIPKIVRPSLSCAKCSHSWTPKKDPLTIQVCPKCKTHKWRGE